MKKLSAWIVSLALLCGMASPALAASQSQQAEIKALGGTPGQINVRLNDKCVAFPDAFPELVNGSTMVPIRAVAETLGASVVNSFGDNASQKIIITLGDTQITMYTGSLDVAVARDGKTEQVKLSVSPYIKADRTYVPLRFISEVFGYAVSWDNDYRTVVMIDTEKLAAEMDANFKVLNLMMKKQAKYTQGNWKSDATADISLEVLDTVNGNKTYKIPMQASAHMGGGAMIMDGSMDLSALLPLINTLAEDMEVTDAQELALLRSLASKQSMAMRLIPEKGLFLKMPLMDSLFMQINQTIKPAADTWYQYPASFSAMFDGLMTDEAYSVGSVMCQSALASSFDVFHQYDMLRTMMTTMQSFCGDKTFTKQGTSYVWSFDKTTLRTMLGAEMYGYIADDIKELSLKMTISENGDYSMSGKIAVDASMLGTLISVSMDAASRNDEETANLAVQLRNFYNFTVKSKSSTKQTQEAPKASLPAGAQIIDLSEYLTGF